MKKWLFLPIVWKGNVFQDYVHICNRCLQKMFQSLRIFVYPNVFNRFFQSSEKRKLFSKCTRQSVYIFFQTNKIMHSCVIWNFSSQFINCWLQSFQKYHPCSNFSIKVRMGTLTWNRLIVLRKIVSNFIGKKIYHSYNKIAYLKFLSKQSTSGIIKFIIFDWKLLHSEQSYLVEFE